MAGEIAQWLERLGLGEYTSMFAENKIDLDVLPELTDDDLKELGVPLGDRKRLLRAITDSGAELQVGATNSQRGLISTSANSEAERRQLTVVFCDLVGSTELSSKLDPEDMRKVLRTYQEACSNVIDRYEGFVAKFMGDGVYAYFGYPTAHEDDAERAIHAGLGIIEAVAGLEHGLAVRIGIATGNVAVGDLIGEGASEEANVVGEAPNLAARLQSIAEPNTVVIGGATHTLAGGVFEFADLGKHDLKGFPERLNVWSVKGAKQMASRFEAKRGNALTELVDREEELEILLRRWQRTKSGRGQAVLISGEPGIGKSRLVHAFQEKVREEDPYIRTVQCSPLHMNSAMFPFVEQMVPILGILPDDSDSQKVEKLVDWIRLGHQSPEEVAPIFGPILGIDTTGYFPPLDVSPQRLKELILNAFSDRIANISAQKPFLYILEDAHWIDPSSLEMVNRFVNEVQALAAMIVITYRPEFDAPWVGQPHTTLMSLNRLDRDNCALLVRNVSGERILPGAITDQIAERTDGVPLFIEELTKVVLEASAEKMGVSNIDVPETLQDSLEARLARLGTAKEIAQIGAVIGRSFDYDLLSRVTGLEEDALKSALDALVTSGLAGVQGSPPTATYTFKHALVQDTAYQSLLKGTRRAHHQRIAEILSQRFPETAETQPELLAHHYTEAGLDEVAIPLWQRAGQRATQRSAYPEAMVHLTKGLDLLLAQPETTNRNEQELNLRAAIGIPLIATKGYYAMEVEDNYSRALELCRLAGDTPELFSVMYGLWRIYAWGGQMERVAQIADELMQLAQNSGESSLLLEAHRAVGFNQLYRGHLTDARQNFEQAIALYDPDLHAAHGHTYGTNTKAYCMMFDGLASLIMGYPDIAVTAHREALTYTRTLREPWTLGFALHSSALFNNLLGNAQQSHRLAKELISHSSEGGPEHLPAMGEIHLGYASVVMGDKAEGSERICRGLESFRATGAAVGSSYFLGWYGWSLSEAGRPEEGISILDEALEVPSKTGERIYEAELHRFKGEVLLNFETPDQKGAETSFHKALEIARSQSAKLWELRAAASLAHLWQSHGKITDARDLLAPIYGWFTEGFDTADLKEAKALLDELG